MKKKCNPNSGRSSKGRRPGFFLVVFLLAVWLMVGGAKAGETGRPTGKSPGGLPGLSPPADAGEILTRLRELPRPIPWEAKGVLVAEARDEYYRMEIRLLAKGPEALRLELFDPFGRPAYTLIAYHGRVTGLTPAGGKPIPLKPSLLLGALAGETGFTLEEALGILWGRVPLIPVAPDQMLLTKVPGRKTLKLTLAGKFSQTVWLEMEPFRVTESDFKARGSFGPIRVSFAEFSKLAGAEWPRKIIVTGRVGRTAAYHYLRADGSPGRFSRGGLPGPRGSE